MPIRPQLLRGSSPPPLGRATSGQGGERATMSRGGININDGFQGAASSPFDPGRQTIIGGGEPMFYQATHLHGVDEGRSSAPSMFAQGSHTMLNGGHPTFQNHTHYHRANPVDGMQLLYQYSSPAATYNSRDRYDPPKCHPNTRTGLLNMIRKWSSERSNSTSNTNSNSNSSPIIWVYGSAGAGKSAVAQTMSEEFQTISILAASFFFSRTSSAHSHRNHEGRFVTTIVYQLAQSIPGFRDFVDPIIYNNPSILDRTLSEQVSALIMDPLEQLRRERRLGSDADIENWPKIIMVDGLDECLNEAGQIQVLEAIAVMVRYQQVYPFMVFLASRPEVGIKAWVARANASAGLGSQQLVQAVCLLDVCDSDHDIEVYIKHEASKIQQTHPFKSRIPSSSSSSNNNNNINAITDWPSPEFITEIVQRASGQFVYASTVMKYVRDLRGYPHLRLEAILQHIVPGDDRPYADLDALYLWILRQTQYPKMVQRLLAFRLTTISFSGALYGVRDSRDYVQTLLGLPYPIDTILVDLQSVMDCEVDGMRFWDEDDVDGEKIHGERTSLGVAVPSVFYHASLVEFLLNPRRSEEFYVDVGKFDGELWRIALDVVSDINSRTTDEEYIIYCFLILIQCQQFQQPENITLICSELSKWDIIHPDMLYDILQRISAKAYDTGRVDMVEGLPQPLWKVLAPCVINKHERCRQVLERARLPRQLFCMFEHDLFHNFQISKAAPRRELSVPSDDSEQVSSERLLLWFMFHRIQQNTGGDAWAFFGMHLPRSFQRYLRLDWDEFMDNIDSVIDDDEQVALGMPDSYTRDSEETSRAVAFYLEHVLELLDPSNDSSKPPQIHAVFNALKNKVGPNWRATIASCLLAELGTFAWYNCPVIPEIVTTLEKISKTLFGGNIPSILESRTFAFDFSYPKERDHRNTLEHSNTLLNRTLRVYDYTYAFPRWFDTCGLFNSMVKRHTLGHVHDYLRLYRIRRFNEVNQGGAGVPGPSQMAVGVGSVGDEGMDMDGEEDQDEDMHEERDGSDASDSDSDSEGNEQRDVAAEIASKTVDPVTGSYIDLTEWSLGAIIRRLISEYENAEDKARAGEA